MNFFSALLIIILLQKNKGQSSDSASASTSTSATACNSTSNEIEELEQKLFSGEDFSLKELTETQLGELREKYLITSSLKLLKDIVTLEDQRGGGGSHENSKYRNTDDFFQKYHFTVRRFAKYGYRNTFSYFILSLPRLLRITPTKSYQNKSQHYFE